MQVISVDESAVVLVAVKNLNAPVSVLMSPVALAHVLSTVLVAPAATAMNPPPVAIDMLPVVKGSDVSISLLPSAPSLEYAASLTL